MSDKKRHPAIWGFTTYFAQGMPYSVIRQISSLFLRDLGVPLESIGLTSLFGLPWILKFLWAPLLDRYGTKRQWMIAMQLILTILFVITTIVVPMPTAPMIISTLFFVASFFAATNDVAIDGYYLEVLDDKGQAEFVGYRTMAYRIAMIFGVSVVGMIGPKWGWQLAFGLAALVFGVVTLFHHFYLQETETVTRKIHSVWIHLVQPKVIALILIITASITSLQFFFKSTTYEELSEKFFIVKKLSFSSSIALLLLVILVLLILFRNRITSALEKQENSFYAKAYLTFIDRPKIGVIFLAIIFIRTGEYMLGSMVAPFFVDLGIKLHYGWISGTVGLVFSIFGALVGGAMIKKFTLQKVLWPFLLLQNLTNLVYMALAIYLNKWIVLNTGVEVAEHIGWGNIYLVTIVQGFDQFSGGLGTAVLMLLLMRLCIGEFKAAHYAIGTAFMAVSGVIAGILGGIIAERLGYSWFFGVSFILSIPGMIAVAFLPRELVSGEKEDAVSCD